MGNWFATMVGVLVGIPIGLEIDRRQRKAQEKVQAEKRAKADRDQVGQYNRDVEEREGRQELGVVCVRVEAA